MPLALLAALLATAPAEAVPNPFACVARAETAELRVRVAIGGCDAGDPNWAELRLVSRGGLTWVEGSRRLRARLLGRSLLAPIAPARLNDAERRAYVDALWAAARIRDPGGSSSTSYMNASVDWLCESTATPAVEGALWRHASTGFEPGLAGLSFEAWEPEPALSSAENLGTLVQAALRSHGLDE